MGKENCQHTIKTWVKLRIDSYSWDSGTGLSHSSCCAGLLFFLLFEFFFFFLVSLSTQLFILFYPPFCLSFFFRPAACAYCPGKLNVSWTRDFSASMVGVPLIFFYSPAYSHYEVHLPQASSSLHNQQLVKPMKWIFCKDFCTVVQHLTLDFPLYPSHAYLRLSLTLHLESIVSKYIFQKVA